MDVNSTGICVTSSTISVADRKKIKRTALTALR